MCISNEIRSYNGKVSIFLLFDEPCLELLTLKISDDHFYFRYYLKLLFSTLISDLIYDGFDMVVMVMMMMLKMMKFICQWEEVD